MPDVWFAVPGDLTILTGGYAYARRLMAALPGAGWTPHHVPLPGSFPNPAVADLKTTSEILTALPPESAVLFDGLAYGALPQELLGELNLSLTALVHHPLAEETGLSAADVARFKASERAALALAQSVVVTSGHTFETLARGYAVPRERLTLAEPGTDRAPRAKGGAGAPVLLTVGTLTHRKAPDVLMEALARIKDLNWTSVLVGSTDRDPAVTAKVRALIAQYDLEDRVILRGEMADLAPAYDSADTFVLPSRHEGYGMVFAEAMAHGLPIIACAAGAVIGTVPADAGLLVPPDDPHALADALRCILTNTALRKRMAENAWEHGQRLPRWDDTAAAVSEALWRALP